MCSVRLAVQKIMAAGLGIFLNRKSIINWAVGYINTSHIAPFHVLFNKKLSI
jgi:hypothetical protein